MSFKSIRLRHGMITFFVCLSLAGGFLVRAAVGPSTTPVMLTRDEDHLRLRNLLGLGVLPKQGNNYDESKANPYPDLPDPLTLNNGKKVTKPKIWWNQRRPQLVELLIVRYTVGGRKCFRKSPGRSSSKRTPRTTAWRS